MRTTARLLTSAALAAAAIGFGLGASGAYAGEVDALEVFPSTAEHGATVTVNTTACGRSGHAVGDARSLGVGEFRLAQGTHKEVVVGEFRIPRGTESGTYSIEVRCKDGRRALGDVVVRSRESEEKGEHGRNESSGYGEPSGHVRTGLGGSVGPDTTQIAAGVAVLAAAAVGGTLLLRRRASGDQGS
ncbi:hypothetical protein ACIBCM_00415 [Streptomyces sp. NPDC051018]|uniref:hypothetical protein n=1 Tax=Streptomyces sp. NPDC051018 TaxID=3365639 RepID=UPI003794F1ED